VDPGTIGSHSLASPWKKETHLLLEVEEAGGPRVSVASEATEVQGSGCRSLALTRLVFASQYFAIIEANYPETVKNLIIIRGEPLTS
jgi:hypothetical protein